MLVYWGSDSNFLYADVAKEHTLVENYGKELLIMDNYQSNS